MHASGQEDGPVCEPVFNNNDLQIENVVETIEVPAVEGDVDKGDFVIRIEAVRRHLIIISKHSTDNY